MKVLVDGQLIEYKDEGKGRVILLLHGWGANLSSFNELTQYLSKHFRVIRFDFPGFGSSPQPHTDWKVADYAHITSELLKKLKIPSLYAVVGHSFGGRVIIKGFAGKELNAEKVVMMGAAGPKPSIKLKKLIFKTIAKTGKIVTVLPGLRQLRPKLRSKLYGAAGSTDYLNAKSMQKIFLNTVNEDLLPEVGTINKPVLMIWGENDREVPLNVAEQMKSELKDAKLVVIPNAGHFVYLDDLAAVKNELEEFLS
jgi:pimeloyl-ACP methyl ester carboxylesterase